MGRFSSVPASEVRPGDIVFRESFGTKKVDAVVTVSVNGHLERHLFYDDDTKSIFSPERLISRERPA